MELHPFLPNLTHPAPLKQRAPGGDGGGAAPRSSLRAGAAAGRPAARRRLRAAGLGRAGAGGGGAVPGTYLLAAAAALGWYRPGSALIGGGGRGALCKCRHRPPQRTARSTAATVSAAARGIAATRVLPRVGVIGGAGCRGAPWIVSTRVPLTVWVEGLRVGSTRVPCLRGGAVDRSHACPLLRGGDGGRSCTCCCLAGGALGSALCVSLLSVG